MFLSAFEIADRLSAIMLRCVLFGKLNVGAID